MKEKSLRDIHTKQSKHCKMCYSLTDDAHPFLLVKQHDRVFICEECWNKLQSMYKPDPDAFSDLAEMDREEFILRIEEELA